MGKDYEEKVRTTGIQEWEKLIPQLLRLRSTGN